MTAHLAQDFPGRSNGPTRSAVVESMRAAFWRAQRSGLAFSALVVVVESAKRIRAGHGERGAALAASKVAEWLLEALAGAEVLGFADADRLVLALPGRPLGAAEALARGVIDSARTHGVEIDGRPVPLRLSIGIADGTRAGVAYVETLVEVAAEGAIVAAASGGNRCVHTQLYEIVQAHLERELPAEAKRPPAFESPTATHVENGHVAALERAHVPGEPEALPPEPTLDLSLPEEVARELESGLVTAIGPSSSEPGRRMLVDFALSHARREWEEASARFAAKHAREVEVLERRIAKLNEALAEAQGRLAEAGRFTPLDPGIASSFRGVQGLSLVEENYELKRELMGMIFKANLELRRQLGPA